MKYDRDFLVYAHNDIKADMVAMGFEPHRSRPNLLAHVSYDCGFCTLRYWRSKDTAWLDRSLV